MIAISTNPAGRTRLDGYGLGMRLKIELNLVLGCIHTLDFGNVVVD